AQWQLTPTQGFVNPFASGPAGVARPGDPVPFNIQVVNDGSRDRVFVLYAMSQPDPEDASAFFAGEEDAMDAEREAATGNRPARGKLAEFDLDGRLQRIYSDDGRLNAPWGVAIAPPDFGPLSGRLLVGNFGGAGRICAFDLDSGSYVDELRDGQDRPVAIPGLWALQFGNGVALGDSNALYFAAGPKDETEGLFGSLRFG
ncbi:MAG: TIGR03118 family protein, partial [Delftia sp.]|nr:TIGR03118 family protein [Delftia sp.]